MGSRQQILHLWLAEAALDQAVVAWAFHDGTRGGGPGLPAGDPPYATGVAALEDGWHLIQSSMAAPVAAAHELSQLRHEFLLERRIESED